MQMHTFLCILLVVPFVHCVIQYKVRGPPMPQRSPYPTTHYTKPAIKAKYPMQHVQRQPPTRNYVRPIPVHMASYKVPVLARPPKTPAPLIFPSAVWKTPTAVYKPPVEKPFLISPPVTQPYEFHLTNDPIINIPTIKQIGEKGPIHTIPAPNLSPADKPNIIFGEPVQKHTYQYTKASEISPNAISPNFAAHTLLQAQALPLVQTHHQYQVTENAEPSEQLLQSPFTAQKTYYAPDPDPNRVAQKLSQQYADTSLTNSVKLYPQDLFVAPQQLAASSQNVPLSAHDLYQLLNGIPQQQQQQQQYSQLIDSHGMPIVPQAYVQQPQALPLTNYQQLLTPQQLLQPDPSYFNQIADTNQIKSFNKPQFQTFNYEEQNSQPHNKQFAQSRVTADYSLEPDTADNSKNSLQNTHEALAQTQYIQQYFTNRDDNNVASDININDLDNHKKIDNQDDKKVTQILSQLTAKNEISPSMFYSSLPSREAAETLATLQAAGNINSNILKLQQNQNEHSNYKEQMRIYVPDEEENYDDMETQASGENTESKNGSSQNKRIYENTQAKSNENIRSEENIDYEDYSTEEENASKEIPFGNKIKAKNNNR